MTNQLSRSHSWIILGLIWLVSAVSDRLWFAIDNSIPSWDQADYLTGALNYWQAFQTPQWWNLDWWTSLWQLSSKIPPGTYMITAIFHQIFGLGEDVATLINLFFSAILLVSVYGLGSHCVNQKVGLWAAGLCILFPGLYHVRLDFLLDYPLTAVVTLCFYCLTLWKYPPETKREERGERGEEKKEKRVHRRENFLYPLYSFLYPLSSILFPLFSFLKLGLAPSQWGMAFAKAVRSQIAFGLSLGLALMIKQTTVLFLFAPILWVVVGSVWRREWGRLAQLAIACLLAIAVMYPWYRTNWLLILTGSKRATIDSAIAEGDPPLNTLEAWTFYLEQLPHHVSLPLFMVAIGGFFLYITRGAGKQRSRGAEEQRGRGDEGMRGRGAEEREKRGEKREERKERREKRGENFHNLPLSSFLFPLSSFLFPLSSFLPRTPAQEHKSTPASSPWRWLLVFWLGAYLLCSLNINKDFRYVMPYLPVVAIFLANGLVAWQSRGAMLAPSPRWGKISMGRWVPAGTVAVTMLLMVVNLWPVDDLSRINSRQPGQHHAYTGPVWPIREAIAEIVQTEPDLRSTLGVLPSTPTVNQHNLNYYGALANFQVYGRQVGTRRSQVDQDVRSLNWFLTKTGDQGSVPEAQAATVQAVQQSPDFRLHKTWPLPDGSILQLYHRQSPDIQVKPTDITPPPQIKLEKVIVPSSTPPGQPVPVTYQWLGNWQDLQNGLLLLTWQQATNNNQPPTTNQINYWLHDRAIGVGKLHETRNSRNPVSSRNRVSITEALAMLPPADIAPGIYTLKAQYFNRQTGENYPLEVPKNVQIKIDPTAAASPAPELDLVTQLRSLATALPLGVDALGPVFDDIGRINQYDPTQDYLTQAELTLKYRLKSRLDAEPDHLALAYNLALAMVLKKDAKGAIAALEKVVQLDPKNPYAHGYLAFVNLYDWRPRAAEKALKPALEIDPNRQEFQILNALTALFQGNLLKTWHRASPLLSPEGKNSPQNSAEHRE